MSPNEYALRFIVIIVCVGAAITFGLIAVAYVALLSTPAPEMPRFDEIEVDEP